VTPTTAFVGVSSEVCIMNVSCMHESSQIDTPLKWHPQQLNKSCDNDSWVIDTKPLMWHPKKQNASWYRYEWVTESCHKYEWVMSNRHTPQVTPTTAFVGVTSEVCIMNVSCMHESCQIDTTLKWHPQQLNKSCDNDSCHDRKPSDVKHTKDTPPPTAE